MRLPRDISPAAASRRALLADLAAALVLAIVAITVAAGIGIVGFFALIVFLLLVAWIGLETAVRLVLRRWR